MTFAVEGSGFFTLEQNTQRDDNNNDDDATQDVAQKAQNKNQHQDDEDVKDISYHPGDIVVYSPPKQRQKWGETQVLPRVNWGDTFFDLFFVAMAFNVGSILVYSPTARGALYFSGCFFPVMVHWREKMFYDARFVVGDDLIHRVMEVVFFMVVSLGVLHISPIEILSNPRKYHDIFAFCLVLTIFSFMAILGTLEIYFFGEGQRDVLKRTAIRDIRLRLPQLAFQIAATAVAGVEYFQNGAGAGKTDQYDTGEHRSLADEKEPYINDLPIWLCLGSFLAYNITILVIVQFLFPRDGGHKKYTIPMNIEFTLHRDGEWIMLMLGESILSLLIVDVTDREAYYITFFFGILTVILLQYLHYRSQPHDPDRHAMRRHKDAAIWWGIVNCIYSASLVCVGVSFKLFMYHFQDVEHRRDLGEGDEELMLVETRALAGESSSGLSKQETQKAAAYIFSISMALVFLCLDVMTLLHRGLKSSINRCKCVRTKKKNKKGIVLTIVRVALIVFFATLALYEQDPNELSLLAFAGVVAQLLIRQIGFVLFVEPEQEHAISSADEKKDIEEQDCDAGSIGPFDKDPEENKWPNVTHAAVERTHKSKENEETKSDS